MKIFGVMMVRNEADILRINVLHHLDQGVDYFLVVDNGSWDGTDGVLQKMSRNGRVGWIRDPGPYHQSEITTELAREAFQRGADWVVPIDADEFWWAPGGNFRKVLEESAAGALEVEVVNFIQRRAQTQMSPDALLHMTRRAPDPVGPVEQAQELFESRKHAFVELMPYPKWISRATASTEIAMGDHSVKGVPEPREKTDEIICLHAPLRARSTWFEKAVDQGTRVRELDLTPTDWWQARRWYELATLGELEPEWRANSYAADHLDVYGASHKVVFDPRLRDLVKPWINTQSSVSREETDAAADVNEDQETKGTDGVDSSLETLVKADVPAAQEATATVPGPEAQVTPAISEESLALAASLTSSEDSIVRLVGSDKRVLVVGHSVRSLSRAIHDRGCQVVAIETDRSAALAAREYVERVVVGDVERLNLFQELDEQSFECVVLAGLLEFVKEPLVVLKTLKKYLRPEGRLVSSVSNVAHGALRIKLLREGRLSRTENDRTAPRSLHSYTRETLEQLLEEAGFVLGRLDRCELPIECSDVNQDHPAVPATLLETLSQDPDARASHFVALAYRLPHPHLELIQERMRDLAGQNEAARSELATLRPLTERVARLEAEVTLLRDLLKSQTTSHEATRRELTKASATVEELLEDNRRLKEEVAHREVQQRESARAMEAEVTLLRDLLKSQTTSHEATRRELTKASATVEELLEDNRRLKEEMAHREVQQRESARALEVQRQESSEAMEAEVTLLRDLLKSQTTSHEATRRELTKASATVEELLEDNRRLKEEVAHRELQQRESARALEVQRQESSEAMEALENRNQDRSKVLDAILTSPGWRLISSYRGWLSRHVWTRPWLRKPYEALAARLLPGAGLRQAGSSADLVSSDSEMAGESIPSYLKIPSDSSSFVHEDDLRFALDSPPAGTMPVRGTIEVRGWAIALEGVSSVTLRIDDGPELSTDSGHLRPDVAQRHSEFPKASRSGFRFRWDTTETRDGVHRLRAALETEAGRRRELTRDVLVDQRDPYHIWIERNEPSSLDKRVMRDDLDKFAYQPTISVLTPVYKTPLKLLSACVESVTSQIYHNWELCLVDDGSADPRLSALLEELQQRDPRIKVKTLASNGGIAGATNAALAMCRGDYVAFLDHDDELADFALFEVVRKLNERSRPDMIYSDEDKMDLEGRRYDWFFKPDWSPDLLHAVNYVCHLLVCRRSLVLELGGIREAFEGSQDFDLVLRMAERTQAIKRIPKILYHWRAVPGSTSLGLQQKPAASSAGRRALEEHLARTKEKGEACETGPCRYRVRRHVRGDPEVSILIPTAGNLERLQAALKSVIDETTYRRFEIVVVDNSSGDQVADLVEKLRYSRRPVRHADFREKPFNFSQLCNSAARLSEAPFYLFLNDDVTVVTAEWLTALVEHAQRDDVGAVGARLLYPNGRIQHAGVVMGVYENAGHHFKGVKSDQSYYFDLPDLVRNCSAVTGACMLLRRERFWEVGGFDEQNLPIAFQDVDLCLKLLQRGYLNVYTPYATLYHHEASSKSAEQYVPSDAEISYMQHRWRNYIENDPYYNPNLTRQTEDYALRW